MAPPVPIPGFPTVWKQSIPRKPFISQSSIQQRSRYPRARSASWSLNEYAQVKHRCSHIGFRVVVTWHWDVGCGFQGRSSVGPVSLLGERDAFHCKTYAETFYMKSKSLFKIFFFIIKNRCWLRPFLEVKWHKVNFGKVGDTCNCSWGCFSSFQ